MMNARSWLIVGIKLLALYLLLEALMALPLALLFLDAPHHPLVDGEVAPPPPSFETVWPMVLPLGVKVIVFAFFGLVLVYKTSRIGDYLRFNDDNPNYGMTEQVFLRSGLTLLGLIWVVFGLVQGLSLLGLPAGTVALAAKIEPWLHVFVGILVIARSRELAFWAQRDRRF